MNDLDFLDRNFLLEYVSILKKHAGCNISSEPEIRLEEHNNLLIGQQLARLDNNQSLINSSNNNAYININIDNVESKYHETLSQKSNLTLNNLDLFQDYSPPFLVLDKKIYDDEITKNPNFSLNDKPLILVEASNFKRNPSGISVFLNDTAKKLLGLYVKFYVSDHDQATQNNKQALVLLSNTSTPKKCFWGVVQKFFDDIHLDELTSKQLNALLNTNDDSLFNSQKAGYISIKLEGKD